MAERFCPACFADEAKDILASASEHYLTALADVTLRGLEDVGAQLCTEHSRRLAEHISSQLNALEHIKRTRKQG